MVNLRTSLLETLFDTIIRVEMYQKSIQGWEKINMLKKINSNYKKELTIEEVVQQSYKFNLVRKFYVIFVCIIAILNFGQSFIEVYFREFALPVTYGVGGLNLLLLLGFVVTTFIYTRRLAKLLPEQFEIKFRRVS